MPLKAGEESAKSEGISSNPTCDKFTIKPLASAQGYRLWAVRVSAKLRQMHKVDGEKVVPIDSEEFRVK